ncbi:DNA-directed RNA polymerase subunit L [Candidatus Hecatella orcuttiae]|jgi:DNA-directed RNA polymerase subunit L|uniref:DNA-directed RNA polymerase subunit L n=1 Tax=Candidatus Hecatella orcuttiae TaxID=1935119 RepID=UPI002868277A|nr:DNA-directed RNA polymerase subunit L [Candidatus Hecatella orcuttiae]
MNVLISKKGKNELEFELQGETHTLLNLLQKTLLKNKRVEFAGYRIPHRLVDAAVFYLKTTGNLEPVEALSEAAEEIKNEAEEFRRKMAKALDAFERGKS